MKKFTLALVAVISAILMCFGMAACSSDVAGNTYVLDDVKVTMEGADQIEGAEEMINQAVESIKGMYEGITVKFNTDGTCTMGEGEEVEEGYFVQDGKNVYIYETKDDADANDTEKADMKLTANGSKLEYVMENGGMTATITFKKK